MTDKQRPPHGMCVGCGKEHDFPVTKEMADAIGAAIVGTRDPFAGLEAALGKLFGDDKPEKHPAGAIAKVIRHPIVGVLGFEWVGDEKPAEGTYMYAGQPIIAKDDQAKAAIQAMQNLGYVWRDSAWSKDDGGSARRMAAVRTCANLGYTYNGGRTWDAPVEGQASNLFPGQQVGQADPGVVGAAQGMSVGLDAGKPTREQKVREMEQENLKHAWETNGSWVEVATVVGLDVDDLSPTAYLAYRVFLAS